MNAPLESVETELAALRRIATEHGICSDKNGSLVAARAFAENLILCSDEEQARALVRQDRAGTAIFLDTAEWIVADIQKGRIEPGGEPIPQRRLPFYAVAGTAIEFLEKLRAEFPGEMS